MVLEKVVVVGNIEVFIGLVYVYLEGIGFDFLLEKVVGLL